MNEARTVEIDPGVFQLDLDFLGVPGVIASYLVVSGDAVAIVETGPTTTLPNLLEGLVTLGYAPDQVSDVLVTHIHLDHAGGAGALLRLLPRARLHVHERGAPHLADPKKLVASATRIYGAEMDRLWGEVVPVPFERLSVLEDGAEVRIGGRVLRALDTPGHASHHLAFHEPAAALVFTGDVAAVRLAGTEYVRPPTPPPDLDLELWRRSIGRLRSVGAERLLLTHFGGYADAGAHLDEVLARLFFWSGWIAARLELEPDTTRVAAELRRMGDAELREATGRDELLVPYELATNYRMTVDGVARYLRKRPRADRAHPG